MGRPCCCDATACGSGEGASRHYWTDPPSDDYMPLTVGGGEAPTFLHDADEAILTLPDDQSASLTLRRDIEPALPVVPPNDGYDLGGHFVYILAAAVRRVAGSIQGVAMLGRYALMFHNDELKWKVHEVTTGGVLGDPLAELTVQDYSRTSATLYLVRSQDNTVKLRMMASFCTAAPMEFVDHDPGEWPTTARVGLLGHNGGSWEYWRVGCGFHKHRCVDGGTYHSGDGGDEDLIHAANHHAAEFVTEGYPLSGGALSGFSVYDPADWNDNSGSIYTEIHNTDGPDFGDIGEILIQGSVSWNGVGTFPGLKVGVFVGNNMIIWEPGVGGTGMFSYTGCTDAGLPSGGETPVRDQRMLGAISQFVFTVRRVAYQGGYNLLWYWSGYLIYTQSVSGEQQVMRAGVYWEDTAAWITFGSPTKWSCVESVVVPCPDCPEELRRNPPIGWQTTVSIAETTPEICDGPETCSIVQDTTTIVNNGCSWQPMLYRGIVPDLGVGSPPLTASASHLLYEIPSGAPLCESVLTTVFMVRAGCSGPCFANLNIPIPLASPGWNWGADISGYAGGPLTLGTIAECTQGNVILGYVSDGCEPTDSITLSPIYSPIVWLHTP